MAHKSFAKRRDPRFFVPFGAGFVELATGDSDGGRHRADIVEASVAGMTLELDPGPSFDSEQVIRDAKVQIGECVVEGELLVKHSEPTRGSRLELGCLFYPSSLLDEEKWAAVLAGLQAARRI